MTRFKTSNIYDIKIPKDAEAWVNETKFRRDAWKKLNKLRNTNSYTIRLYARELLKDYGTYKAEFSLWCMKRNCGCVEPEPKLPLIREVTKE